MQESLKESVQHQLHDVEKRRDDLMPEHQKVQKRDAKDTKPPGQKEKSAERELGRKRRMRKLREELDWKEERFRLLSDKVDENRIKVGCHTKST